MEKGSKGFSPAYWRANFSDPDAMDGIGNAKDHARYLEALFALEGIEIDSVIDFGFGLGHLLKAVLWEFRPSRAVGIEPSEYAFKRSGRLKLAPEETDLILQPVDLATWARRPLPRMDLGLCTSVLQYLSDEEISDCLPSMAIACRYLYLTVPTDVELDSQKREHRFHDGYAVRRTREAYQALVRPHFTFISFRLLESRIHFDETTTRFSDRLYRF